MSALFTSFQNIFEPLEQSDKGEGATYLLPSTDLGFKNLYGGQVFSQAIYLVGLLLNKNSLQDTFNTQINPQMKVHSCHAFFVRAGNAAAPISFDVQPVGRGRSFQRFEVTAFQKSPKDSEPRLIFKALISAQLEEAAFIQHHKPMPDVPLPDTLMNEAELRAAFGGYKKPKQQRPLEIRFVNIPDLLQPQALDAQRGFWFRFLWEENELAAPHSILAQASLAYASDYGFVGTLLLPHGLFHKTAKFYITSLDHAMWFYGPYQPTEWSFFDCDTVKADQGRGMVNGRIYQQNQLIALVAQEGLIRARQEA